MAKGSTTKAGDYQVVWWLKDEQLHLGKYLVGRHDKEKEVKSLGEDDIETADSFRIHYYKKATKFDTTLSTSPNKPEQFHEGIVSRVLEKLSARVGNLNGARYWRAEWQDTLKRGKQHANKDKDGTSYYIAQHSF